MSKAPITLLEIERFLRVTGWGHTRFGRAAVNDPRFVLDLRNGGEIGPKRQAVVAQFIKDHIRDARKQVDKLEDMFR